MKRKASGKCRYKFSKSISDVLIIVDENCINHMRISRDLRRGFMEDFICEANMTDALCDVFRLADFEGLELSQYKLIIFAYCFQVDENMRNIISKKIPKDVTVMYNYSSGVLYGNCFCLNNVKDFTGFEIYETGKDGEVPGVAVRIADNIKVLKENSEKEIVLAKKENKIINLMPFMKSDCLREIEKEAGCTFYTDRAGNTVYGDNRFIGIFSPDGKSGEIKELL